jgi:hypothetical protein
MFVFFSVGLYYYVVNGNQVEGFAGSRRQCGTMLIKKDGKFIMYNSNALEVPGVNPIVFNSLEEYAEYKQWEKSQGIECPILELEQSYGADGYERYEMKRVHADNTDTKGIYPSYVNEKVFNEYDASTIMPSSEKQ